MATRVIKLREAEQPAPEMGQEVLSQSKRPEVGRFLLQLQNALGSREKKRGMTESDPELPFEPLAQVLETGGGRTFHAHSIGRPCNLRNESLSQ
jgi:hypothetical protein